MVRILAWNIQTFGDNKFNANTWDRVGWRELYIISTIQLVRPDILVVIEPRSGGGGQGKLMPEKGAGTRGVLALLNLLRAKDNSWCVVPPQILKAGTGYNEGIAVFFKSTAVEFQGPLMWSANTGVAVPLAPGGGQDYPAPWAGALPNGNTTINGVPYPQNQLAGRTKFTDANGEQINFPRAGQRSIFQTTFSNGVRTLNLFSVHFPPFGPLSGESFASLALVPAIAGNPQGNEDRVVLGDFNLNAIVPRWARYFAYLTGGIAVLQHTYPNISALQYTLMIADPTMLRYVLDRDMTNGNPPNYGYMSDDGSGNLLCYDNIFVARAGAAPAAAEVINRVIQTDFMLNSIPEILLAYPNDPANRDIAFQNILNFGSMGAAKGASDHMPLVVDLP
jgi:hypothetical protein